jgi:uncharacterized protein (TIGR01777 family)
MAPITQRWRTVLPDPPDQVWAWHARPGAFLRLAPPWEELTMIEGDQGLDVGARTVFTVRKGPIRLKWVAEHTACEPGRSFVDEQREGPFASWRHTHAFLPDGDGCALEDEVVWKAPGGPLGALAVPTLRAQNERMFAFRHRRTARDLARHAPFRDQPPLTVAITGASGLVGGALCAFLTTGGHKVVRIGRGRQRPGDCAWDLAEGTIDLDALRGVDAIVHLAGASVSERWTPEHKRAILESRVRGTQLVVDAIRRLDPRPKVLVSASAIGLYGDRGDEELTEDAAAGEGFLADVGRAWEAAAAPVTDLGVRLVTPRIGIVTTAAGGMLGKLLPLFRAGAGGTVGSGRQWVSWIDLDDLVAILHRAAIDPSMAGPYNCVAPNPVQQREQARAIGRAVGLPAIAPAPAFALRALMGEMAEELVLGGQRVLPERLLRAGFVFDEPTLDGALRHTLGAA